MRTENNEPAVLASVRAHGAYNYYYRAKLSQIINRFYRTSAQKHNIKSTIIVIVVKAYENISFRYKSNWDWELKLVKLH